MKFKSMAVIKSKHSRFFPYAGPYDLALVRLDKYVKFKSREASEN